jgi:hypothetical protein
MYTALDVAMERLKKEMAAELENLGIEIRGCSDLENSEIQVRQIALKFGTLLFEELLERRGTGYAGEFRVCSHCDKEHRCVDSRKKTILTLVGPVTLRRAYYPTGKACDGHGFPLDEELGIAGEQTTPGMRRAMSWMGAMGPFVKGEETFFTLSGVRVSKTLIWNTAETVGKRLTIKEEEMRDSAMETPLALTSEKTIPRLYGTLDGTKIHLEEGWKEIKVMAWYEPMTGGSVKRDEAEKISFAARLEAAEKFGEFFWSEGRRRGLERAKEIVIIGDGAPWIWNLVDEHVPTAIQIVDYYHARQHLWEVAYAIHGEGTRRAVLWVKTVERLLIAGRIEDLIDRFRKLRPMKAEARDTIRKNIAYFTTNNNRMRYRTFRRKKYHIGSGIVEGACKHLVGQRQKGPGMIWSPSGAQAIASLRAAFLSHGREGDVDNALRAA